jgi:adenosine deaminase
MTESGTGPTGPTDSALFALPKAELHLHIEGTLEPELVFELAGRNGVGLPYASIDELKAHYDFSDLQSFLNLYYSTMDVLRTESDFTELTRRYLAKASTQGVRHVELFFDPQAHTGRGIRLETVVDGIGAALDEAERDLGITSGLILSFLRDQPVDDAETILSVGLSRTDRIIGVGLDSAEVGHPPSLFEHVFARARDAGLHVVAHAGEEGPPEYIREAIDLLGVERVDHGIRTIEDPELVARLAGEGIALTMCPLSNVRLRTVDDLAEHPLRRLDAAGVRVTVNSDDPAYFGGYVGDNFVAVRDALGVTAEEAERFARTSIEASFAPDARKEALLSEIDGWLG